MQREVARDPVVTTSRGEQRGLLVGAHLLRPGAAGTEPAAAGRVDRARQLAAKGGLCRRPRRGRGATSGTLAVSACVYGCSGCSYT